ncbi:MAG: hypothetical protein KDE46_08025 [Caldilineaceae bacterium]|nr:hypothetical protein [Caldilineaceae bacterium]
MPTPQATVCNPLLRTPLSLLIDDSCPVINLNYFWIQQRHAWNARHRPGQPPRHGDGDIDKLTSMPQTIPADFARQWAEWCAAEGVRGKFSMVPYPAGVARIDRGFPDFPRAEYDGWMQVTRDLICPNFDITCEMLTHTHVVDLQTWQFTEAWEQFEWRNPDVERLTDYIAASMQIVVDAGLPCQGVTSPGGFGTENEATYAKAIQDAALRVTGDPRPFYLLHVNVPPQEWPDVPLWHVDKAAGRAVASIIGCTDDWFGNWTGYDAGDADLCITADLQGGALPQVLNRELPCVLVSHWPGFYFGGEEVGFDVLKTVKRRLDAYDPDGTRTRWMTFSEIGRYWMARELSDIQVEAADAGGWRVYIQTNFPTANFTLALEYPSQQVCVGHTALKEVTTRQALVSGTFLVENGRTLCAFDLPEGQTELAAI